MKKILTLFFAAVVIFFHSIGFAQKIAEATPYVMTFEADVSNTDTSQNFYANLHIKLEKGWKIYAPETLTKDTKHLCTTASSMLSFEGSSNVKTAQIEWPTPQSYQDDRANCSFFGYEGDVTVPVRITPQDPGQPVTLEADFRTVACNTLCIPVHQQFHLEMGDNALSLWVILGALLGGFILNFMPCVLPVLSLKMIHLMQGQSARPSTIRRSFSLTALGIWTSFLALAFVAVALREAGESVGWGMHFQNPYFINGMMMIVALFAANLWGLFDIGVPAWASHLLPKGLSNSPKRDFFNGVLATLLATPCSAPFVGTALSVALSQGPLEIILIFFMMGVGLSLPYMLVGFVPQLATMLPKPGQWMIRLTRILAMGLLATALWLLFIALQHQDFWWIACEVGALILVVFCFSKGQHGTSLKRFLNSVGTLLLGALFLAPTWSLQEDVNPPPALSLRKPVQNLWVPFNEKMIAEHVSDGRVVIVDITADWCLTCIVNKKLVLNNPRFTHYLASTSVIGMRGDWTKKDPMIAQFLKKYGRYGIPFNIVFGPGAPQGILLSEILTTAALVDALTRAGAKVLH